jgi:nascent polypeptide-associated complex subunit alpha
MDPKQMSRMMKQMGIDTKEVDAKKVVIETGSELIEITSPQVVQIEMQGQKSFQISGIVETKAKISEDDLKMVMEQTSCTREDAEKALKDANGDIAEAILKLQK